MGQAVGQTGQIARARETIPTIKGRHCRSTARCGWSKAYSEIRRRSHPAALDPKPIMGKFWGIAQKNALSV